MCLIQNKLKYTGNKRITCYKVLESDLISPYQGFQYILNHKYDTLFEFCTVFNICKEIDWGTLRSTFTKSSFNLESFSNNLRAIVNYHQERDYNVVTNGFHTFKDLIGAEILKQELESNEEFKGKYIIVKCIIPEYTWYYEGLCDFSYCPKDISYASESIIIEEIL